MSQFTEKEMQDCIRFHKEDLGRDISKNEAISFLLEQEQMEELNRIQEEYDMAMADYTHQGFRNLAKNLAQKGVKPLISF